MAQPRRALGVFQVAALSLGLMAPTAAMALNGSLAASIAGTAVPLVFLFALVAEAADAAAAHLGWALAGSRVAIQGFGAVGQAAAVRLLELGAVVVSVSNAMGAVHDDDGLDIARLVELRGQVGDDCVIHYGGAQAPESTLTAAAEILIPAAREDTITDDVARETSARLIVEGANLPTSPSSRRILHDRGIAVVPDFIANAGGIVAAAHSTAARNSPFVIDPADIFAMISTKLRMNTSAVLEESLRSEVTPHEAAMQLAQRRVGDAMLLRRQSPTA